MGGKSSRDLGRRPSFDDRNYSQHQSRNQAPATHQSYPPPSPHSQGYDSSYGQSYSQPYAYPPSPQTSSSNALQPRKTLNRKYSRKYSQIADNYRSLDQVHGRKTLSILRGVWLHSQTPFRWKQVTEALAQAGLESSNLIVGIDFTKSNEWTGKHSFNHRSLHFIGDVQNPYEQAISIIGRTLSAFDEDNMIPCFGFGDASTHDQDVFSFYPDERPCNGFAEALTRYREIVPQLRLAGPTSFSPIIEMAMTIVEQSGGQYHVLLIIADGQVTRSVDTEFGQLSSQEQKTVDAIVKASDLPLSIILVGVGDGPWDMMREFDDNIPARAFDNFQFVNFTEIMLKNVPQTRKETEFALSALMEIPSQYKATVELGILGHTTMKSPERVPLPPPFGSYGGPSMASKSFGSASYPQHTTSSYPDPLQHTSPSVSSSGNDQVCPICLTNPKNMAFGCGHQTCYECGPSLQLCPICRSEIVTRIRLY